MFVKQYLQISTKVQYNYIIVIKVQKHWRRCMAMNLRQIMILRDRWDKEIAEIINNFSKQKEKKYSQYIKNLKQLSIETRNSAVTHRYRKIKKEYNINYIKWSKLEANDNTQKERPIFPSINKKDLNNLILRVANIPIN